jgi:hypothetical protein
LVRFSHDVPDVSCSFQMTADGWGWELRRAVFGSIPVYEEKMSEDTGELELFRLMYLYERTASSGRGDESGKRI